MLKVKVIPNQRENEVKQLSDGSYEVKLKSSPEKNKANKELIKILTKYFGKKIRICSGLKSREFC